MFGALLLHARLQLGHDFLRRDVELGHLLSLLSGEHGGLLLRLLVARKGWKKILATIASGRHL